MTPFERSTKRQRCETHSFHLPFLQPKPERMSDSEHSDHDSGRASSRHSAQEDSSGDEAPAPRPSRARRAVSKTRGQGRARERDELGRFISTKTGGGSRSRRSRSRSRRVTMAEVFNRFLCFNLEANFKPPPEERQN